jgi:hypothetical protein
VVRGCSIVSRRIRHTTPEVAHNAIFFLTLCGFCQRIHEERLDRFALVGAVAAVVGIEIAAYCELVELTLRHHDRPQEEAALVALAVPSSSLANLFLPIRHAATTKM